MSLRGCAAAVAISRLFLSKEHRPVAVPGVRLGDDAPALPTDRCHALRSLYLPLAALPSLPLGVPQQNHTKGGVILFCVAVEWKYLRPSRSQIFSERRGRRSLQRLRKQPDKPGFVAQASRHSLQLDVLVDNSQIFPTSCNFLQILSLHLVFRQTSHGKGSIM